VGKQHKGLRLKEVGKGAVQWGGGVWKVRYGGGLSMCGPSVVGGERRIGETGGGGLVIYTRRRSAKKGHDWEGAVLVASNNKTEGKNTVPQCAADAGERGKCLKACVDPDGNAQAGKHCRSAPLYTSPPNIT